MSTFVLSTYSIYVLVVLTVAIGIMTFDNNSRTFENHEIH